MKHKVRLIASISIVVIIGVSVWVYNAVIKSSPEAEQTSQQTTGGDKGSAQAGAKGGKGSGRAVPVTVYIADNITLEEGIRSIGTLVANEDVVLNSEISGKVDRIAFDEGSHVSKGSLLVKVNDDDLQSQLKRAVFQRNMLKEKLDRNRILLQKDAISREAFDQIETDYNMVEADIQLLEVRIAKCSIRAPFDGVVGFRYISLGTYLQPNIMIARLVDYSKLKVEFSIPEKHISEQLKGMQITFTTEGSDKIRNATVYAMDPMVDQKTRTIILRALYNNRDLKLMPGMFAKVNIGKKAGQSIVVPSESITSEASGRSVWIVKDGKSQKVVVNTGTRTANMVEITAGLVKGDSVIVAGIMQAKEGAKVQVTN